MQSELNGLSIIGVISRCNVWNLARLGVRRELWCACVRACVSMLSLLRDGRLLHFRSRDRSRGDSSCCYVTSRCVVLTLRHQLPTAHLRRTLHQCVDAYSMAEAGWPLELEESTRLRRNAGLERIQDQNPVISRLHHVHFCSIISPSNFNAALQSESRTTTENRYQQLTCLIQLTYLILGFRLQNSRMLFFAEKRCPSRDWTVCNTCVMELKTSKLFKSKMCKRATYAFITRVFDSRVLRNYISSLPYL